MSPPARDPAPGPAPRRYDLSCTVDAYRDGWALADYLAARFRYHPRDLWGRRVAEGAVRVNGARAQVDTPVAKGDRIEYTIWHAEPEVDFRHEVLYEDDWILAVAKSGNLPVHAGGKFIANTLVAHLRETREPELWPAHRLDRETSGVVVFARSRDAARALELAFRERRVEKEYFAVLRGETPDAWTVDAPIARREPAAPPYFRVVDPGEGKAASTRFRRLAILETPTPLSLVEAVPSGGRTNQIRVHAFHSGHPILGDKIYGIPEVLAREFVAQGPTEAVIAAAGAARHLLHCARLVLPHPAGDRPELDLVAPLPDDFPSVGGVPDLPARYIESNQAPARPRPPGTGRRRPTPPARTLSGRRRTMPYTLGPRRGVVVDARTESSAPPALAAAALAARETFDLYYRSLCALLYNYVPQSGHPGGSISSGRFVASLLFGGLDHDVSDPDRPDADLVSYAAGHKALGLYALWALRDEIARIGAPELLPADERKRLRLEDMLGFRRNPTTETPLFREKHAKALDGHPTPATPFVKLSTGASGVGVTTSVGLAWGAMDTYGRAFAPRVHIVEGEGGMTPGRVAEAVVVAGTLSLGNAILHVDWNQSSIDSDHVCRDGEQPGDYVQWDPRELCALHDWNVVDVADGFDLELVAAAQRQALAFDNGQPTAIVYRTTKGWQYGIEGRKSHGAGHGLCSDAFFEALKPLTATRSLELPSCPAGVKCCSGDDGDTKREECFWNALAALREALEAETATVATLATALRDSRKRLDARGRKPRADAPNVEVAFERAAEVVDGPPLALALAAGTSTTLRGELGKVLGWYNRETGGAFFAAAADLLDSTSVSGVGADFAKGWWHPDTNPASRLISIGGICEDAISGVLSGLSSARGHIGVGSSYGAFLAPLGHISARLHAIGAQARREVSGDPYPPMILVCAHAGLKTGEDGPTHADPQPLQLVQENFPPGTAISLTPWDPAEMWWLMSAALAHRPAVIFPFVTRPNETVPDREALGLAPASEAAKGMYRLRAAYGRGDGALVLQGSRVRHRGAAAPRGRGNRSRRVGRHVGRAVRRAAGGAAPRDLPGGARPRGDGDHRLHDGHALSLDHVRARTCRVALAVPWRPLPRQRSGAEGAARGGPRRRRAVRGHPRVARGGGDGVGGGATSGVRSPSGGGSSRPEGS